MGQRVVVTLIIFQFACSRRILENINMSFIWLILILHLEINAIGSMDLFPLQQCVPVLGDPETFNVSVKSKADMNSYCLTRSRLWTILDAHVFFKSYLTCS